MSGTLQFDEASHSYHVDGQRIPSVTQVLSSLYNFSTVDPFVLERKRQLGVDAHLACELFDRDELDQSQTAPIVLGYVEAWCRFLNDTGAVVVLNEHRLHHSSLRFAGTIDRLLRMPDGSLLLADLKTGESSPVHALQLAGYKLLLDAACESEPGMKRGCVHLHHDGTYRLVMYSDPQDLIVFRALLTVWRWKEAHP